MTRLRAAMLPSVLALVAVLFLVASALNSGGTSATAATTQTYFRLGAGFTDVVPHQIVRAADDRLYVFADQADSPRTLHAYWTVQPGLPASATGFATSTLTIDSDAISVEAAYGGGSTIHVLVNMMSGALRDYPFDVGTRTFKAPISLATDAATYSGIGTSGLSAGIAGDGTLHVAYWSSGNHVTYRAYTYNAAADTLLLVSGPTQVDDGGRIARHPSLAVSPVDGSVTVAWVSPNSSAGLVAGAIYSKTRSAAGIWGAQELVSAAPAWTSTYFGIDIDQGPSLVIGSDGVRRLAYIEYYDASGDYGRIHYATRPAASAQWSDSAVPGYTHDPALALDSLGDLYLIGHGHPENALYGTTCLSLDDLCVRQQNPDGTWGSAQLFAQHQGTDSFDASVSVKWSAAGWNRPASVELAFFSADGGSYSSTSVWYGRLDAGPAPAPTSTPAATSTPTPTPAATSTPTPTPAATSTPTQTPTSTPAPSATSTSTPTATSPTATATSTRTPVATSTPTPTATATSVPSSATVLVGDSQIEGMVDSNPPGMAEAFLYTAGASGTASRFSVYVDGSSNARQIVVGIYSGKSTGHPGSLLAQATLSSPRPGAWNTVSLPSVTLRSGTRYWLAILGPIGTGKVSFHDSVSGATSETSKERNLTALPSTWSTGTIYVNSPMSAYVSP